MEELQAQIDEINSRLDENDSSIQDFSDTLDSSINDLQSTIDDQSTSIEDLNESKGQLEFPLTQDTIDLIKEQFPGGFVTLVAGSYILKDLRISPTSVILLTVASVGGTQGFLSYVASAGQVVINSSSNTETSVVAYLILN